MTAFLIERAASPNRYWVRSNGMSGGATWTADEAQAGRFPTESDALRVIDAYRAADRWTIREATR